jgi:hypothetical protein
MTIIKPDIIANLRFFSESEGGRESTTPPDYLGCIFEYEQENFECRLLLEDVGPIAPGGKGSVPITFLRPDLLKQRLHVGSSFRLRALRPIAEGIVEKILQ